MKNIIQEKGICDIIIKIFFIFSRQGNNINMLLAEDYTKEYFFDLNEWSEKPAYKAARLNASKGLFGGISNMSSSGLTGGSIGFGQGFSDTINNRISNVLSGMTQTAINSSLNGQPLNLDLGSLALSSYSNSIGAQISYNLGLMLNQPEFNLDTGGLNISQRGGLSSVIDESREALFSTLSVGDGIALESDLDTLKVVMNSEFISQGGSMFAPGLMPVSGGLENSYFADGYYQQAYKDFVFNSDANWFTRGLTNKNFGGNIINNHTGIPNLIDNLNNPESGLAGYWEIQKAWANVVYNFTPVGKLVGTTLKTSNFVYNVAGNMSKFAYRLNIVNNVQKTGIYFDNFNKYIMPYIQDIQAFYAIVDEDDN